MHLAPPLGRAMTMRWTPAHASPRNPMPSPRLLTPALLVEPAQHSARVVAAEHLREVSAQFDTFVGDPSIGVHDLRVAMRRLRTWLRAYRPELDDTVRKKTRRRAAKIAHATNEPRD